MATFFMSLFKTAYFKQTIMKRYLLFAGEDYYPSGGAKDLEGDFDTIDEAVNALDHEDYRDCWAHVFDLTTKKIVKHHSRGVWID